MALCVVIEGPLANLGSLLYVICVADGVMSASNLSQANYFAMACLQFTTVGSTTILTSTSGKQYRAWDNAHQPVILTVH